MADANGKHKRTRERFEQSQRDTPGECFGNGSEDVADSFSTGMEGSKDTGNNGKNRKESYDEYSFGCSPGKAGGPAERGLGGVVDGVPTWMDAPDIPRVTTNQAGRVQRLKMLGNAVVPQVVYQLGLAMKELWDEV